MKALKAHLAKSDPARHDIFVAGIQPVVKKILTGIKAKQYQFYLGESMNPEGLVALLDYREDGVTPFFIFFKDGLIEEKCVRSTHFVVSNFLVSWDSASWLSFLPVEHIVIFPPSCGRGVNVETLRP